MEYPVIDNSLRLARLQPPQGKVRMVLDTDTYNEIDDQFAVVHALLSPDEMTVEAIYAAPFYNLRASSAGDGMEKSYEEIARLLDRLNVSPENLLYRGADQFLPDLEHPVESPAALDLVERAMQATNEPLYVVAIGAATNVASAILMEPRIMEKIVVIWLGGHGLHWAKNAAFNLAGDVLSSRVIMDCGVPLVMIPCKGVTTHLRTTVPEIERFVQGRGAIGDYLTEIFKAYHDDHFAWSKEIWDIVCIAYLINASWSPSNIISSPIISQSAAGDIRSEPHQEAWRSLPLSWSFDDSRHPIRYVYHVERDPIFADLFKKLDKWAAGHIKIQV
ncbi:MAG: nucleoside hydrolase [Chloroflexota bacterium]